MSEVVGREEDMYDGIERVLKVRSIFSIFSSFRLQLLLDLGAIPSLSFSELFSRARRRKALRPASTSINTAEKIGGVKGQEDKRREGESRLR